MAFLSYIIRRATNGSGPHPCIFLLHGYGSNANDLYTFASYLPEQLTVISLEAPLFTPFGGKAWYSIHFNNAQDKWSDLEEAKKSLTIITEQLEYFINRNEKFIQFLSSYFQN